MDYLRPGLTMLLPFPQFSVKHVSLSLMTVAVEHGEDMALSIGIRLDRESISTLPLLSKIGRDNAFVL